MKKILALLLILTCLFSVVACNNDTPDNGDQNTPDNGNSNNDVTIDPETDPLGYFSALLKKSVPTLSEVVATQKFGRTFLPIPLLSQPVLLTVLRQASL